MTVLGLFCCICAFCSCGKHGLLFLATHRLLIDLASLVGHSVQGVQASVLLALRPSCGLSAPQPVASSLTRGQPMSSCSGRWILTHCTTREVPHPPQFYFLHGFFHHFTFFCSGTCWFYCLFPHQTAPSWHQKPYLSCS